VALADIIARIEADASSEADTLLTAARVRSEELAAAAEATAVSHRAEVMAAAERDAARAADTIVVTARLAARDRAVGARRGLVGEALERAVDMLAALPDGRYAEFLAARVAETARGGEMLSVGSADTARRGAIVAAVRSAAPGLEFGVAEQPAPFERGVLLSGDRVRVDLSLTALVIERSDDLELVIVRALFGEEA